MGLERDWRINKPVSEESRNRDFTTNSENTNLADKSGNESWESMKVAPETRDGGLQSLNQLTKKKELRREGLIAAKSQSHLTTKERKKVE